MTLVVRLEGSPAKDPLLFLSHSAFAASSWPIYWQKGVARDPCLLRAFSHRAVLAMRRDCVCPLHLACILYLTVRQRTASSSVSES